MHNRERERPPIVETIAPAVETLGAPIMETATAPGIEKAAVVDILRRYIATRSGIDRRNYQRDYRDADGYRAFMSDYRDILRDGRDARKMLAFIVARDSITAADILAARNGNGRLAFERVPGTVDGWRLEYTAGQYFAVEYRAAACGLLAGIIRRHLADGGNSADYVRREAAGFFGRGVAARWFA